MKDIYSGVLSRKFKSGSSLFLYEFTQLFPQPAWVEHDPEEILRTTQQALDDVVSKVGRSSVVGIGITNQRETTIIWDQSTGKPIYNAIVWQCRRTHDTCQTLSSKKSMIKSKTGLFLDPYFSATKINWILSNVSGYDIDTLKFGTVDTWILWHLTNKKVHATDPSNASRTLLYNIHTLDYDEELLSLFSVPKSILPDVKPSSGHFGKTVDGIPILGVIGDQQAALFTQCGTDTTTFKNTYGTGLFIVSNTGSHIPKTDRLINTIAWQIGDDVSYALEGSVFVAGAAVQWLRDQLGIISSASEIESLAKTVKNSGGVTFIPALAGLAAPYWDPHAKGTIMGITRGTQKGHIARATLEAIAMRTKEIITAMEKDAKFKFEQEIVFNPKSELSYLYLSKIFNKLDKKILEEQNLNTVMLLNPKNEEAIYLLTLLKIKKSNYSESEKLIKNFKQVCNKLCDKQNELNKKFENIKTQ